MLNTHRHSTLSVLTTIRIVLLALLIFTSGVYAGGQAPNQSSADPIVLSLILRHKYNEAITRLEEVLEREPANGEALTYMATAKLYQDLAFLKAQKEFEEAFKAGGGATFYVTHSHEKLNTDDVVDYCRGWLHLRKSSIEFVPNESNHGFKLSPGEVQEIKRNRLSKKAFHVKIGGKNQNFRGRSNTEFEPLLIIALYKSFNPN